MSQVTITVRGESETRVRAEEAAVRVTVSTDGPTRGPVVERAQERAASVQDGLVAHLRSGEVSEWSSARVSVWSDRPWNSEGAQLPLVHRDPFDRMLVAQALQESLTLVTSDRRLAQYGIRSEEHTSELQSH